MTDLEILAKNVKRFRLYRGMTQIELASKVGLSSEYFSKIEVAKTGNIGFKYLTAICRELDIQISELFMETAEVNIKFVVSNENLQSMENLIEKITERIDIRFKVDTKKPIFYHTEDCGCAYCKLKKRREK